jgi:hypothetical protein
VPLGQRTIISVGGALFPHPVDKNLPRFLRPRTVQSLPPLPIAHAGACPAVVRLDRRDEDAAAYRREDAAPPAAAPSHVEFGDHIARAEPQALASGVGIHPKNYPGACFSTYVSLRFHMLSFDEVAMPAPGLHSCFTWRARASMGCAVVV